ncbi:acetate kinase [Leucobacter rhizosphaerae]|uniref:Acetate kinase n=1 Tax=Leucobacter rhizosphaerae TaxID=2932245 RepID=A0ABY4FZH1_9MICO|nr:acetate kinase [Leucobacter rhizosphaerae]UOQ61702.1 acetate kinase [Leucobacter rhizosphaerae]
MSAILVVNSGSSSIKYQLIDAESEERLASGLVERIGEQVGRIEHHQGEERIELEVRVPDHTAAFAAVLDAFAQAGTAIAELEVAAVGHRVVQGGSEFVAPTLITDAVAERILALRELAPLHNPAHHQAIVAARAALPDVPHVAVFDTAFHQSMPPHAYTYAIDTQVAAQHGVRRYGFHGISHLVVSRRAAALLERPVSTLRQIVLHLGNGASACAIDGGRSIDTSMGLTPLEGLVMGTRSGDLDPGALLHLLRSGMDVDELDRLLNQRSGLLGLTGSNDFRDVRAAAASGDAAARLAIEVTVHAIRRYLGAYLVALGGADTIVFTAGVGENAADLRAAVCADLEWFGVRLDPARNEARIREARRISTDDSRVAVLVVPTDEEAEIARQTWELITA